MPNIACQVIMPYKSGLAEDVVVNTFAFGSGATPAEDMAAEAASRLTSFYMTTPSAGGTSALNGYLSTYIRRDQVRMKAFDLADPQPRAPIYDELLSFGTQPSASDSLPFEVALCGSFQGNRVSGQSQARRRGRIYLGPFRIAANSGAPSATDMSVPSTALVNNLAGALIDLANKNDGTANWVVWSRAGNSFSEVTNGWVDNAWDSQRRRGVNSTSRITWSAL